MSNQLDGGRPLPWDRDQLGRFVREAWVRWALTQPSPKPSWLVPYDELREPDKEADRQIGEAIARWVIIGNATALSIEQGKVLGNEVQVLREALEFYSNERGWHTSHVAGPFAPTPGPVLKDRGAKARAALAQAGGVP